MNKLIWISIGFIFLFIIITGCNNNEVPTNHFSKSDVYKAKDSEVLHKSQHSRLQRSKKYVDSSTNYTLSVGFAPDKKWMRSTKMQNESFQYINNAQRSQEITGKIFIDNKTKKNQKFTFVFIQGNQTAEIKTKNSHWSPAIDAQAESGTHIEIPIIIKWKPSKSKELTIFPIDQADKEGHYGGGTLGLVRFFVSNRNHPSVDKKMIQKQAFKLPNHFNPEKESLAPVLDWFKKGSRPIQFVDKHGDRFSKGKVEGFRIRALPYHTHVDVVRVDEYGNTDVLAKNINIHKGESNEINIEKSILDDLYKVKQRQFIIVFNNRNEQILADVEAVNKMKKPLPTTSQSVIELYKPLKKH